MLIARRLRLTQLADSFSLQSPKLPEFSFSLQSPKLPEFNGSLATSSFSALGYSSPQASFSRSLPGTFTQPAAISPQLKPLPSNALSFNSPSFTLSSLPTSTLARADPARMGELIDKFEEYNDLVLKPDKSTDSSSEEAASRLIIGGVGFLGFVSFSALIAEWSEGEDKKDLTIGDIRKNLLAYQDLLDNMANALLVGITLASTMKNPQLAAKLQSQYKIILSISSMVASAIKINSWLDKCPALAAWVDNITPFSSEGKIDYQNLSTELQKIPSLTNIEKIIMKFSEPDKVSNEEFYEAVVTLYTSPQSEITNSVQIFLLRPISVLLHDYLTEECKVQLGVLSVTTEDSDRTEAFNYIAQAATKASLVQKDDKLLSSLAAFKTSSVSEKRFLFTSCYDIHKTKFAIANRSFAAPSVETPDLNRILKTAQKLREISSEHSIKLTDLIKRVKYLNDIRDVDITHEEIRDQILLPLQKIKDELHENSELNADDLSTITNAIDDLLEISDLSNISDKHKFDL